MSRVILVTGASSGIGAAIARRISVLRRVVWPYRVVGTLFQAISWLGDVILTTTRKKIERKAHGTGHSCAAEQPRCSVE